MNAPEWLIDRPIAHRGLHGVGIGENSRAGAQAAIKAGFAIECDIQLSADGEAMVFHDERLERLTNGAGEVSAQSAAALAALHLRIGGEPIPTLAQFLAVIDAGAPVICEIKSSFSGDLSLARRALALARDYAGPLAFKSFDPQIIAYLRAQRSPPPLGIVAQANYDDDDWRLLTLEQKRDCANFLHFERTRPDFLSWSVADLPHPTPFLLRSLQKLPVMVWTVRAPAQRETAKSWADQIVFEGAGRP